MKKKFWISLLLLLLIVFCVGVGLSVKTRNAMEQHTIDAPGVEYSTANEQIAGTFLSCK